MITSHSLNKLINALLMFDEKDIIDESHASWYQEDPIYQKGNNLPPVLTLDTLDTEINKFIFDKSGSRYGMRLRVDDSVINFTRLLVSQRNHIRCVYKAFGKNPEGLMDAREIILRVFYAVSQHNTTANIGRYEYKKSIFGDLLSQDKVQKKEVDSL